MPQDIGAHHPLRLLAAAVVGRPVSISYLVDPAAAAWTDGERIYLPGALPAGECARTLLVQCALLAGGAMRAVGLRTLVGSIELRERFLVLEVERCCRLIESRLPGRFLEAQALAGSTGLVWYGQALAHHASEPARRSAQA
jgi:nitric oxide reductase NorD protein